MLFKAVILSMSMLLPLQGYCEQYYFLERHGGHEIRVNPYHGKAFDFNFDFSDEYPDLESLSIASGKELEEYFKNATDDLGLRKNRKLKEIKIKYSKHFIDVISKTKLPKLKSLFISCAAQMNDWDFLFIFPALAHLEVECADNANFTHLLKNVYSLTQLKTFSVFFDDYITPESTQLNHKQVSLLSSLTQLELLSFKYFRILTSKNKKSEKSYYKRLAEELKKKLPHTEVVVELSEQIIKL